MNPISTEEICYRKYVRVLGTTMAYVDVGSGDPIVFLHGNPTPSYLWRNIIPHLLPFGRCLAPDYVGMGNSGSAPDDRYRFVDHQRYLDAWFEALGLDRNIILVVHDWGSALGFAWAQRNPERVKAIIYMESIVRPFLSWDEWPDATRAFFQAQRSPKGEELILEKNLFIEYLLPLRNIAPEVMEVYRRHYRNPGPSRIPMLAWTRDLPIAGEPADVVKIVESYSSWLSKSSIPKLFIDAEPAGFLIGAQREFCRSWPNQQVVTVPGAHFLQEDSPEAVGQACRALRGEGAGRSDCSALTIAVGTMLAEEPSFQLMAPERLGNGLTVQLGAHADVAREAREITPRELHRLLAYELRNLGRALELQHLDPQNLQSLGRLGQPGLDLRAEPRGDGTIEQLLAVGGAYDPDSLIRRRGSVPLGKERLYQLLGDRVGMCPATAGEYPLAFVDDHDATSSGACFLPDLPDERTALAHVGRLEQSKPDPHEAIAYRLPDAPADQ